MKKILLVNLPFYKSSSDFQRTFFDCCWKVKTLFYVSAGNFVEKQFFRKRSLYHHFRTFIKKIRQLCQTLSFGKFNFIIHGHGVIFFRPLFLINFCRGSRNSILRVKPIALMKIIFFLEILYIFFQHFQKLSLIISAFYRKISGELTELHSTCPWEHLDGKKTFETKSFFVSSGISVKNFFGKLLKTCRRRSTCPQGKFWWKTLKTIFSYYFLDLPLNIFGLLSKSFRQAFQNSILCVHGNSLTENDLFWKNQKLSKQFSTFKEKPLPL